MSTHVTRLRSFAILSLTALVLFALSPAQAVAKSTNNTKGATQLNNSAGKSQHRKPSASAKGSRNSAKHHHNRNHAAAKK
jgi:hypothetical protein